MQAPSRGSRRQRWCAQLLLQIVGTPAEPSIRSKRPGVVPYVRLELVDDSVTPHQFAPRREDTPEPRAFSIFRIDVGEHGPTDGRPGRRGLVKVYRDKHSAACRQMLGDFSHVIPSDCRRSRRQRPGRTEPLYVKPNASGRRRGRTQLKYREMRLQVEIAVRSDQRFPDRRWTYTTTGS